MPLEPREDPSGPLEPGAPASSPPPARCIVCSLLPATCWKTLVYQVNDTSLAIICFLNIVSPMHVAVRASERHETTLRSWHLSEPGTPYLRCTQSSH